MARSHGHAVATRFRVNVVGRRFGKRFTSTKSSPVIVPNPARPGSGGSGSGGSGGSVPGGSGPGGSTTGSG